MASNGFEVSVDDRDVIKALNRLGYNAQNVVANFLRDEALRWQKDIRQQLTVNGSVKSGDLRRSIGVHPKAKFEYIVGTNLFYAPYVEFGTEKTERHRATREKPYIQPVYDKRAEKFKALLTAVLKEALR